MPQSSSQTFLRELDKKLRTIADRFRSNLDAPVHKHAATGLILLKYGSASFAERQAEIEQLISDPKFDIRLSPEDHSSTVLYEDAAEQELEVRDYYLEKNVFFLAGLGTVTKPHLWWFLDAAG